MAVPTTRFRIATRLVALLVAVAVILPAAAFLPSSSSAASDYLLMPRSELLGLRTGVDAWSELKSVADDSLGTPDLCDQDSSHHLHTLAAALVFARTGTASYGTKARQGVMAAISTQRVGCHNATLSLGRQLLGYVLAADFAALSGADDTTFRTWLRGIRTKNIGGHSRWYTLKVTHEDSAANWGAHAGASRIAASLYLGDTADVAAAANVTRGFLGDRARYAGFGHVPDSHDIAWSCGTGAPRAPLNAACSKQGIDLNGAFAFDVSRGGSLRWPPADPGIQYQLESIQGAGMQVELLYRNGYSDAWRWSSDALKRAAALVTRSDNAGGTGWNETTASRQMPWLLNKRYGTSIPTRINGTGRLIGFTSWLYGSGSGSSGSTVTPKPPPPTVSITGFRLATTNSVPMTGVPTLLTWNLETAGTGLRRYQLQLRKDDGAYAAVTLSSPTTTRQSVTLAHGRAYTFRVRAIDTAGQAGPWVTSDRRVPVRYSEAATAAQRSGTWANAYATDYIGGAVRYTRQNGATFTLTFRGASVAWVGPIGPTRGKAKVYIDGAYVATVDLRAASFRARRVVFARTMADGPHTITIEGLGTAGRPVVAIDAFYVVDPR